MALPTWQAQIRSSLVHRNQVEQSHSEMIEHCRRLNEQLVVWKERNRALLAGANGSAQGTASAGGGKGDGGQSGGGGGAK